MFKEVISRFELQPKRIPFGVPILIDPVRGHPEWEGVNLKCSLTVSQCGIRDSIDLFDVAVGHCIATNRHTITVCISAIQDECPETRVLFADVA